MISRRCAGRTYSAMSDVPSIIPDTPAANGRGLLSERMRVG